MNRYYAELLDITGSNEIVRYGYAFMAKNMFDARMHAMQVCRQMQLVPLPTVWRVNKDQYSWMRLRYSVPVVIDTMEAEDEAA